MSVRKFPIAAGLFVLAATVLVSTAGASRDRTRPTTPTNLRITASTDTSVSLAWDASRDNGNFWYCVQRSASGAARPDFGLPSGIFATRQLQVGSRLQF